MLPHLVNLILRSCHSCSEFTHMMTQSYTKDSIFPCSSQRSSLSSSSYFSFHLLFTVELLYSLNVIIIWRGAWVWCVEDSFVESAVSSHIYLCGFSDRRPCALSQSSCFSIPGTGVTHTHHHIHFPQRTLFFSHWVCT